MLQYHSIQSIPLQTIFVGKNKPNLPRKTIDESFVFFSSGRFSSVKKCIKKETPDQIFAAKIIKKRNIQHALNELRIFELSLKHPNFVSLYQVFDLPSEAIFILE